MSIPLGLLKFCLEHGSVPVNEVTAIPEHDQADYDWLRKALSEFEDDVARARRCAQVLADVDQTEGAVLASLEELADLVEGLDLAADLHKFGSGYEVFLRLLQHENALVRYRAALVLAAALQNNDVAQKAAHAAGLTSALAARLTSEKEAHTREAAVLALSAMLRGSREAQDLFFGEFRGFDVLGELLMSDELSEKASIRVLFLTAFLLEEDPHRLQNLAHDTSYVDGVLYSLRSDSIEFRRVALEALLAFVIGHPQNAELATAHHGAQLVRSIVRILQTNLEELEQNSDAIVLCSRIMVELRPYDALKDEDDTWDI